MEAPVQLYIPHLLKYMQFGAAEGLEPTSLTTEDILYGLPIHPKTFIFSTFHGINTCILFIYQTL